jgi:DNA-binding CsgD family transcriptional regulator
MTMGRSRRGPGLPDVPDFGGGLARLQDRRITEILTWARDNRQSWLLEFFDRRLNGAMAPDPQAELVAALTESQLAASSEGVVLTCDTGRILFLNHRARDILAKGAWLLIQDGHLKGASPKLDAALRRAIAATIRRGDDDSATRLRLEARSDGEPLLLRLASLRLPDSGTAMVPFVTIHIVRDDIAPALDEQSLIGWYALSPSEARLAIAFANGATLADYAASHGVTINTVRTLFSRLKAKMGAADQAAVVRKVLLAATRA